eukprot:4300898-Pleurochrysis_carterae.AAC.1
MVVRRCKRCLFRANACALQTRKSLLLSSHEAAKQPFVNCPRGTHFPRSAPSLADMLPHFPEDSIAAYFLFASVRFVSCDSLKLAIERGFSTWSDNHPLISFVDITATRGCANRPPPDAPTAECPWEIYVSADTRTKDASRAAYVTTYQASYFGERYWETETRSTAGTTRIGVDATRRAVMRFQTRICWCCAPAPPSTFAAPCSPQNPLPHCRPFASRPAFAR